MNFFRKLLFQLMYLSKPPWDTNQTPPELNEFMAANPAGRALDLGCGTGTNVITLAKNGWRVVGVDFVPKAIHAAREKAILAGVDVEFFVGDVTKLDYIEGSFDLILDIGCYHTLNPAGMRAYREQVRQLLAPGGTYLIYLFFKEQGADSRLGGSNASELDLEPFSEFMDLVQREDGTERGLRRSAWITYRKSGPAMEQAAKNKAIKQIVEDGYDRVAQEYARLEGEVEWPRMNWLNKLLAMLEPGSSVLDLGCGSGDPAGLEISKKHDLTGVDISESQIKLARQNLPDGSFIHGDAGTVDFPSSSFDAVISFYTLEHIPREEHGTILRRIHKWLRQKGYLLISIEADEYDDEQAEWLGVPMFISSYDPETMKKMVVDAGFKLIETAIETQLENSVEIPFLWVFAQKN